jgi:hypothetical protein
VRPSGHSADAGEGRPLTQHPGVHKLGSTSSPPHRQQSACNHGLSTTVSCSDTTLLTFTLVVSGESHRFQLGLVRCFLMLLYPQLGTSLRGHPTSCQCMLTAPPLFFFAGGRYSVREL